MKIAIKALASLTISSLALMLVPLSALAESTVPPRLAGITAAKTAAVIAEQTGWTGTAILASSTSYGMVDALTAGPLASYLKAPILLTGTGALDSDTKAELNKLEVKTVYVTSGTAVISQTVLNELTDMGMTVVPLSGADKYDTSLRPGRILPPSPEKSPLSLEPKIPAGISGPLLRDKWFPNLSQLPLLKKWVHFQKAL